MSALLALAIAAQVLVYVPPAPALGGWTWAPGTGATAHNVYASRNGGPFTLVAAVPMPASEITLPFALGDVVEILVEPLALGTGAAPGPLSDPSLAVRFAASPDSDGDGTVRAGDVAAAAAAFSRCIRLSARGTAVPATACAP